MINIELVEDGKKAVIWHREGETTYVKVLRSDSPMRTAME